MGQTATLLATALLQDPQTQVGHGFAIGDVVRWDGVDWVYTDNTSEANSEQVGMVSGIADVDHFYLTQDGRVTNVTVAPVNPGGAFVPGTLYYLSSTPGKLTATKPSAVGVVELPCYVAYSATNGYFFSGVGTLIESGSLFQFNAVNSNTTMVSNNGYKTEGAGAISLELPAVYNFGDVIKIATSGTGVITITQPAFTNIQLVDQSTTPGITGTLTLQPTGGVLKGTLELVCLDVLLGEWMVMSGTGIWTPA